MFGCIAPILLDKFFTADKLSVVATPEYCQTSLISLLQGALAERSQEEPHKVLQGALRL